MSRLDFCQYELVDDCYDWKNDNCDECNIFKAYCEGARRAKNSIVRCKDCKHWQITNIETIDGEPVYDCPFCGEWADANGFCSFGELAEQTDNKLPGYDEIMEKLDELTLKGGDHE